MSKEKTLYLLDAYALIYRAYYAFIRNPRVNSRGMNTSAIFGFTNALYDVLQREDADHVAVAFDPSGETFRNEDYSEYKANREEMPDDIRLSVPYIRQIIEAFNVPILEMEGYEADDVIGTIAKQAGESNYTVYMVTPDKDYGQLVTDKVKMLKPSRQGNGAEIWGIEEICKKFEVEKPMQVIDILGLMGDSVDNIPGIPGVGEKTAKKLIKQFGSIEKLVESTEELKGKLKERVEEHKEQALLSKKLATIITDVPVEFDEKSLRKEDPDSDKLREIFSLLEFRTMAQRILGEKVQATQSSQMDMFESGDSPEPVSDMGNLGNTKKEYKLIDTKDKRARLVSDLKKQKEFCFDTETSSLNPHETELVGIAFSWKKDTGYYIPLPENKKATEFILKELEPVFSDKSTLKIGQNLKFDMNVLKWYGMDVAPPHFDTLLAHYLLQPDLKHSMDYLSETYLNYRPVSIETLIGKKGKNQKSMRDLEPSEISDYAAEDADVTYQLKKLFAPEIKKQGLTNLFEKIEMPLMPVLADMESAGVAVDRKVLEDISKKLEEDIQRLEKEIHELAGMEFNVASPKQLGEVLFEHLQIVEKPKKTKSGQYATNEETLQKLADKHPIIDKLFEFREYKKLKNTYVDALPELISERDGRIHTTFQQAVAATGRLSSQNPNLQNIPIRTERGREIRKAFVASDDNHTILAADYSQIELRIIAELSEDKGMMDAFINGHDIHAATASKVFGVDPEKVSREMRSQAKVVNFGIAYGISAFGLAQRINISRSEAGDIIKEYFKQFPGIKEYMDKSIEFAREHGYVETIMKRRRYLKDINSGNAVVRGFAERNAINAPIQGSAADMIKIAMIEVHREMKEKGFKSKMVLQVHDELIFDALHEELEELKPLVERCMKGAVEMKVPIEVEMGSGENWLVAH